MDDGKRKERAPAAPAAAEGDAPLRKASPDGEAPGKAPGKVGSKAGRKAVSKAGSKAGRKAVSKAGSKAGRKALSKAERKAVRKALRKAVKDDGAKRKRGSSGDGASARGSSGDGASARGGFRRHPLLTFLGILVVAAAAADAVVFALFAAAGHLSFGGVLSNVWFWLSCGVADGLIAAFSLMAYEVDAGRAALRGSDMDDTEWMSAKKLKNSKAFAVFDLSEAGEREDGIVIGAVRKGGGVEITETREMHALIVGTTGSGKTTGFVDQNISVLSMSSTKPSMVISDPKRELLEKHSKSLLSRGYSVRVLDLRDPFSSERWNPMDVLIRRVRVLREIEYGLVNADGKYSAAGYVFASYDEARAKKREVEDEVYDNARELVYTLCPIRDREQPGWEDGARNLILGFVLAMCEDCVDGRLDEESLVLFNVYHNITKYLTADAGELKRYLLEGRDEFSKVRGLVNTVLVTSDRTLTSYLSEVNAYMQRWGDEGILSMTSGSDIRIADMDERPTATFLVIPDERTSRHVFATLFISQAYRELTEKANENLRRKRAESARLLRNVYFVLDEFGNLPRIEGMENLITVGRSRGLRMLLVLQSFSQLTGKYGREAGDTVKSNCNVKIFIGSDDAATRREFSELCGTRKARSLSVSVSRGRDASSSSSAQSRPVISEGALERLNGDRKGDAVVSVRGYEPLLTRFTPSYELGRTYFREGVGAERRPSAVYDREGLLYDITGGSFLAEAERYSQEVERKEAEAEKAEGELTFRRPLTREEADALAAEIAGEVRALSERLEPEDRDALLNTPNVGVPFIIDDMMEKYGGNGTISGEMKKTRAAVAEALTALRGEPVPAAA